MLIARGCRDDRVRAPVAEAIPTRMCGGKGNRVRGQSPLRTAVVAKTIMVLRNIRRTPVRSIVRQGTPPGGAC
jgi:hypothetical protein